MAEPLPEPSPPRTEHEPAAATEAEIAHRNMVWGWALFALFWVLFAAIFGRFAPPISAGFGFGYVCYDSIHYAIHHFAMKRGVWLWLKQYHLRHHYNDDHAGYGVSSPLWDYIFRTNRR